ncbi:hypothetical protein N7462_003712 [Penicillium macrosclerotiorum]|uniref:uncharacterized protein n=1 Tax=Penicillium macrosclerotiorum TaxID=303699 RepID=UPI0025468D2E|nr:uncharacterized protein N7462_003712 [Penicillium macrosclerotiorum]KAJ5689320.1 hypothetical protein N7462_003712 [Penicillium macrosclerotiorum]
MVPKSRGLSIIYGSASSGGSTHPETYSSVARLTAHAANDECCAEIKVSLETREPWARRGGKKPFISGNVNFSPSRFLVVPNFSYLDLFWPPNY